MEELSRTLTHEAFMLRSVSILAVAVLASCSEDARPASPAGAGVRVAGVFPEGGGESGGKERSPQGHGSPASPASDLVDAPTEGASRRLLERLPASTLFALRLPRLELLPETWRRLALARTIEELPGFGGRGNPLELAAAQLTASAPMLADLLALLPTLRGELVLALTGVGPGGAGAPVSAMLLLDAGGQADELQAALEPALQAMRGMPGYVRRDAPFAVEGGDEHFYAAVRRSGGVFTAAFGSRSEALALASGTPRQGSFLTTTLVGATPDYSEEGKAVVLETYFHAAPLWALARAALPPEVLASLQASGLSGVEGASAAMALTELGLVESLTWCSPGRSDLVSRTLSARGIAPELVAHIPDAADGAAVFSFDAGRLLAGVLESLPEAHRAAVLAQIQGVDELFRIDLKGDLFENLGPTVALAFRGDPASWAATGAPRVAALIELEDAERARRLLSAALAAAGGDLRTTEVDLGGATATRIEIPSANNRPPLHVSVALAEGRAVISTDDELLRGALEEASDAAACSARIAAAMGEAGGDLWCVAAGASDPGPTLGSATDSGLVIEAREGSGNLVLVGMSAAVSIPAAVAIPKLLHSRLAANEKAAVAMLRGIASAQRMALDAGVLDIDRDGRPEALLLHELSGRAGLRGSGQHLDPPMLSDRWSEVRPGAAARSGYAFRVDLPASGGGATSVSSDPRGLDVSVDGAETSYVIHAWPLDVGKTGARVFALDSRGSLWVSDNRGMRQGYSGFGHQPACDAFVAETAPAESATAHLGRDGGSWQRMR